MSDLEPAFARARAAAASLPEVEESLWYGTPALKVRGKAFMRVKDEDTLVILCPVEDKELLIEAAPEIYFETDHYRGYPMVLVRVSAIGANELRHRLERAWRSKAPPALAASFAAAAEAGRTGRDRR